MKQASIAQLAKVLTQSTDELQDVKEAQQEDKEARKHAFKRLFDRRKDQLFDYCLRLVRYREEMAKDVCQEAWLVAWRKIANLDDASKFWPWLRGIAQRRAMKIGQSAKLLEIRETAYARNTTGSASDTGIGDDEKTILLECVNLLTIEQRQPVQLYLLEQFGTMDECAAKIGIPTTTFRGRLDSAKVSLEKLLSQRGLTKQVIATLLAAPVLTSVSLSASKIDILALIEGVAQEPRSIMSRRMFLGAALMVPGVTVVGVLGYLARQRMTPPPPPLPPPAEPTYLTIQQENLSVAERDVVDALRQELCARAMPDGPFPMARDGAAAYVTADCNFPTALAILSANYSSPNEWELKLVANSLEWYARRSQEDGFASAYRGDSLEKIKAPSPLSPSDASAWFLLVLERFRRQNGLISPAMHTAARRAFQTIQAHIDPHDGLTQNLPGRSGNKYLVNSILARGGLGAAADYFRAQRLSREADQATALIQAMSGSLKGFWSSERSCYALTKSGQQLIFVAPNATNRLFEFVQAWGYAHVEAKPEVWKYLADVSRVESTSETSFGLETLAMATAARDKQTSQQLRTALVQLRDTYLDTSMYSQRTAFALLAILEGHRWLPKFL